MSGSKNSGSSHPIDPMAAVMVMLQQLSNQLERGCSAIEGKLAASTHAVHPPLSEEPHPAHSLANFPTWMNTGRGPQKIPIVRPTFEEHIWNYFTREQPTFKKHVGGSQEVKLEPKESTYTSRDTGLVLAPIVRKVTPPPIKELLFDSSEVHPNKLPDELPLVRDIQHATDLVPMEVTFPPSTKGLFSNFSKVVPDEFPEELPHTHDTLHATNLVLTEVAFPSPTKGLFSDFSEEVPDEIPLMPDIQHATDLVPMEVTFPPPTKGLFSDFSKVVSDELPNELPLMHDTLRATDLVPSSVLPNLPSYHLSPTEPCEVKRLVDKVPEELHTSGDFNVADLHLYVGHHANDGDTQQTLRLPQLKPPITDIIDEVFDDSFKSTRHDLALLVEGKNRVWIHADNFKKLDLDLLGRHLSFTHSPETNVFKPGRVDAELTAYTRKKKAQWSSPLKPKDKTQISPCLSWARTFLVA